MAANEISVDYDLCDRIGNRLNGYRFAAGFLNRNFITLSADRELKARMYFFSVAICHQTHNLYNDELSLSGWEYLEYGFLSMAQHQPFLLDPECLAATGEDGMSMLLQGYFINNNNEKKCTLDRLHERSSLLLDAAVNLLDFYEGHVTSLLDGSNGLIAGENGFYKRLSQMIAFSDPLKKKSSFFLKLLMDSGIYSVKDPENIEPIVDYHMQRVLLRAGALQVNNPVLLSRLRSRHQIPSDHPVRSAAIEAMRLIAERSGIAILKLNDIFWPLGRSCCHNNPICISGQCEKSPCTLSVTLVIKEHANCILSEICKGETDQNYREIWHPVIATHYY